MAMLHHCTYPGIASTSLFGAVPAPTATKNDATAPPGAALGPSLTATALGATPSVNPTSTTIAVPPPSMLKGKSIEEIINKWTNDLEVNIREFNKYASEVAVWDRALIENSNNVSFVKPVIANSYIHIFFM